MNYYFEFQPKSDYLLVNARFDIVSDNSKIMDDLFEQVLKHSSSNILLNLTDVSVIDSLGLGKLLKFFQRTKQNHKKMVLFGLNNQIKYLFHITQLEAIMSIDETEETSALKLKGMNLG
ncbi:MAG: STAS domain-containing protein [Candidatus Delongbacteria bacterium]|nr:STAS domain-containing protein [Candidatus Delongbacteria bacterium]